MAQRPHALEISKILGDGRVFHYTCNPPDREVLDKLEIRCIGQDLGCEDAREVLIIPKEIYKHHGYELTEENVGIVSEQLLRKL